MQSNLSFTPTPAGQANRLAAVTGTIPPGLTLLAFRDAYGPLQRDTKPANLQAPRLSTVHAALTALVAAATMLLVVFA